MGRPRFLSLQRAAKFEASVILLEKCDPFSPMIKLYCIDILLKVTAIVLMTISIYL